MSKVVEDLPRKTRSRKYPIDLWFDGRAHELEPAVDFPNVKETSFKTLIYNTATERGVKVKLQWETDEETGARTAYLKKIRDLTDEEKALRDNPAPAPKARKAPAKRKPASKPKAKKA